MIYFLINNNFHLIDAEKHLEDFKDQPTGLIKIPHKLTIIPNHPFDVEMEFPPLIKKLSDHFRLFRIFKIHQNILKQLKHVNSNDTLLFYTEYEYLSHFIISLFKKKQAKVILIEEGFPTYLTFSSIPDKSIGIKKKILNLYLRYIIGYRNTTITSLNSTPTTIIDDKLIDQLLLYNDIQIHRNVKSGLLPTKSFNYTNLEINTALFLNEGIYENYITEENYLVIIDEILKNLSANFEKVHFKFHPRETEEAREKTKIIIKKYKNISIVLDNNPVELMIDKLGASYIFSFGSQTLLYLASSNCHPVYIFHLFPDIMKFPAFLMFKTVLESMNYQFMENWSEIKNSNNGFKINSSINPNTLKQHIGL